MSENTTKCFCVALAAVKTAADYTEIEPCSEGHELKMYAEPGKLPRVSYFIDSALVTARSLKDARELGLEKAQEMWPESEGYFNYTVGVARLPRSLLESLLGMVEE